MTSTNDFPTTGVKLRYLLVASDYARSLAFYCDVLGATVIRQISDVLCLLNFGDSEFLLTVGGGPTTDKPTVTFAPPIDPNTVSSELNIRVPDCYAAYEVLRSRGERSRACQSMPASFCKSECAAGLIRAARDARRRSGIRHR